MMNRKRIVVAGLMAVVISVLLVLHFTGKTLSRITTGITGITTPKVRMDSSPAAQIKALPAVDDMVPVPSVHTKISVAVQSLSSEDMSFMETYKAAKRGIRQPLPSRPKYSKIFPYFSCLKNFTDLSSGVGESYSQMNATQQRLLAEKFWLQQQGRLWMQHTRKGGGTSLCMALRLNQHGLVHTDLQQWTMPRRETCQITSFCLDCDLTQKKTTSVSGAFQGWNSMPRLIECVTNLHQRNFIELEGTVSPPNIRTHPEWADFVFISTLRHPIARIISSLHNDPPYTNKDGGCFKPTNPRELNHCAQRAISSVDPIMAQCHRRGIYFCYSNYYVRMFAGHPVGAQFPVTRDTLEAAQNNFRRYSCVVLQEEWTETAECLKSKLGLHLTSETDFNVEGGMLKKTKHSSALRSTSKATAHANETTFLGSLDHKEYETLVEVNQLDLEFYEWARELILDGYFINY